MNYVLLGESETLPLLLDAIGQSDSKLLAAACCDKMRDAVTSSNPETHIVDQWEDLLSLNDIDAVIVAGAADEVLAAARQFATNERPLILLPDVGARSVFTYELSLIRDDTGVKLIPAFAARSHPAVLEFQRRVGEDSIGKPLQIRFDRIVDRSTADGPPVFSVPEIDARLLADADLIRLLGGEYNQVTAIRTGRTDDGAATANVTLAGDNVPEAVWTLNSGPENGWSVTVIGEKGRLTLTGNGFSNLQIDDARIECTDAQLGAAWLADLDAALDAPAPVDEKTRTSTASLTDLTRVFEIVDGSHESVRRRRTIDLYFETTSERNLFKTQMAAMGCLVLTWTLLGMVGFLIAGTLISGPTGDSPGSPDSTAELSAFEYWMWHVLRIVWIAPLVIFSIAQVLLVLARPAQKVDEV